MSHYNYILKLIKVDLENIDENDENYSIFFEDSEGFDKLKDCIGISCSDNDGEVIILNVVTQGSEMIRPRDLNFPKNTFYGNADSFINLNNLNKHIKPELLKEPNIKIHLDSYLKYANQEENFIIMAY